MGLAEDEAGQYKVMLNESENEIEHLRYDLLQHQSNPVDTIEKEKAFLTMLSEMKPEKEEKINRCAEEEFFFLTASAAKINMGMKMAKHSINMISTKVLWNEAQQSAIPMHQFHSWLINRLQKHYK